MDDPAKWATPKVILPPEYPPGQLAAKSEGHVDVEVKLDKFGMVQSIVSMKSTPPNPEFESAVQAVVQKWWAFHETLSPECAPLEATGNVRVWFAIREGKGVVSVSGEATEVTKEFSRKQKKAKALKRRKNSPANRYPDQAIRDGIEGEVYSYVEVDAATGIPITAHVTAHFGRGGDGAVFEGSVLASMKASRFEPMEGPNYRVCRSYRFRLKD
ncbi:MAG: TonB family protein [Betaproteobacteria bacterium]|nr:TonB family protein [Betaproteobacteria bacterium]